MRVRGVKGSEMKVVSTIYEARETIKNARGAGKTIGLVPTMGALHEGHLSLVRASKSACSFTAASIFVNPIQFNDPTDYNTYPRDTKKDLILLEKEGVDLVFNPSVEEMYRKKAVTCVSAEKLSGILEGKLRLGHFNGVCTVVCKLFNIITPDRAYFGWKDAQQLIIIRKMTEDLNIPVEVIGCPTIREKDGLAGSSRNIFIAEGEREKALSLYKSLKKIEEFFLKKGINETAVLLEEGRKVIDKYPDVELQYLEIADIENLEHVEEVKGRVIVLGAIKLSRVRLIDNLILSL